MSFLHFITSAVSADLDAGSDFEVIIAVDVLEDGSSNGKIVYTSTDMMKPYHSRSFFNIFRPDKEMKETIITDADILC